MNPDYEASAHAMNRLAAQLRELSGDEPAAALAAAVAAAAASMQAGGQPYRKFCSTLLAITVQTIGSGVHAAALHGGGDAYREREFTRLATGFGHALASQLGFVVAASVRREDVPARPETLQ